jgi:hypothetical protein
MAKLKFALPTFGEDLGDALWVGSVKEFIQEGMSFEDAKDMADKVSNIYNKILDFESAEDTGDTD